MAGSLEKKLTQKEFEKGYKELEELLKKQAEAVEKCGKEKKHPREKVMSISYLPEFIVYCYCKSCDGYYERRPNAKEIKRRNNDMNIIVY